jgi:RimJ/RimL family protein N-acetyltransferase
MRGMNVSLSALTIEHAEAMHRWMCDSEVAGGIGLLREPSLEATRGWIERANADRSMVQFAILADDEHVGNVRLDQIDSARGLARLEIFIGEGRSRGVGQEALRLLLDRAFGEMGLHRVWLTVHVRNARAIRAYLAVGFQVEGTVRGSFILDGRRIDQVQMSVLASDQRHG